MYFSKGPHTAAVTFEVAGIGKVKKGSLFSEMSQKLVTITLHSLLWKVWLLGQKFFLFLLLRDLSISRLVTLTIQS